MDALIERAVEDLAVARRGLVLTGAGVSTESGIPPFRGKGGLWEKFDPMEVGHIDAFMRDPAAVWNTLFLELGRMLKNARPNAAHFGLAELERLGKVDTIITQNIDGLHQRAGSTQVIEFHGTFARQRCMACDKRTATDELDLTRIPPRCECGGLIRPDCILFGEIIPGGDLNRARESASRCDVLLVVGTSAVVQPAAMIPLIARDHGARVIEINTEPTPLTGRVSDYLVRGSAGAVLETVIDLLNRKESSGGKR
ncbi:MAG: SIR2 family NAD-dependent protein deacylase [Desulfobacterales bacterium]